MCTIPTSGFEQNVQLSQYLHHRQLHSMHPEGQLGSGPIQQQPLYSQPYSNVQHPLSGYINPHPQQLPSTGQFTGQSQGVYTHAGEEHVLLNEYFTHALIAE